MSTPGAGGRFVPRRRSDECQHRGCANDTPSSEWRPRKTGTLKRCIVGHSVAAFILLSSQAGMAQISREEFDALSPTRDPSSGPKLLTPIYVMAEEPPTQI